MATVVVVVVVVVTIGLLAFFVVSKLYGFFGGKKQKRGPSARRHTCWRSHCSSLGANILGSHSKKEGNTWGDPKLIHHNR
jgi:hypothetical protein